MAKITLNDVTAGRTDVNVLNANSLAIETFSDNCLTRDGTSPNNMNADLDMDGNKVMNVAEPVDDNDAITKIYFEENYTDQVDLNTANIATNAADILANAAAISANGVAIADNASEIAATNVTVAENFLQIFPNIISIGTSTFSITPGAHASTVVVMEGTSFAALTLPEGSYQDGETYKVINTSTTDIAVISLPSVGILGSGDTQVNLSASNNTYGTIPNFVELIYSSTLDQWVWSGRQATTAP